jgi:hypothetical protein
MKQPMAGWIFFAAVMMLIVGALDLIEGLIAVIRDKYYVLAPDQVIVFDTTTWGWIMIVWGALLILGGLALMRGATWARMLAIFLAALNLVGQLGWLGASSYPVWSLVIIGIDLIVLYALTARWEGFPEQVR